MNKENEFNDFHKQNMVKMVRARNETFDPQTFDFKAYWDSSLDPKENYSAIFRKMRDKGIIDVVDLDESILEDKADVGQAQATARELDHEQEKFQESIEEIKNEGADLDSYFYELKEFVSILGTGDIDSLFLIGEAGIGKSYNTLKKLSDMGTDFSYWQGNITPLKLYQMLYEHNGEIIFFDDTQSLIKNKKAMSLLCQALWSATGERKVSWLTSSNKLDNEGIPEEFVFDGKIIFSLNEIPESTEMRVLLSRCYKYELEFSYQEKLKMMYEIAKEEGNGLKPKEREMIVDFINEHTSKATKDFNLRLMKKVEEIFKASDNWKDISRIFLVEDDEDRLVLNLVEDESLTHDEKVKKFKNQTGKSKRTFQRKKAQLIGDGF